MTNFLKPVFMLAFLATAPAAMATELPIPPVPPEYSGMGQDAPMPDPQLQAPSDAIGAIFNTTTKAELHVAFYRADSFDKSSGFAPGSQFQSKEDRKPIQTPGFNITMPF